MENEIELYGQLTSLKLTFKQFNQISWELNQLEKKYPLQELSFEEMQKLLDIYLEIRDRLKLASENL